MKAVCVSIKQICIHILKYIYLILVQVHFLLHSNVYSQFVAYSALCAELIDGWDNSIGIITFLDYELHGI